MSLLAKIYEPNNHPETFRLGIIAGFILYSAFGFLDVYMLPENYTIAWRIRFFLVGPSLILPLLFSYYKWFHKYLLFFTNLLIGIAQLGIFLMIFAAKPYEYAYYDYYMGLVLVILWGAFIFKMNNIPLLVLTISTSVIYIFYMIHFQKLLSFGMHTPQFAAFFNNTMFLISMTSLAVLGNYLIDEYYSNLIKEKRNLQSALKKAQESDQMKSNFLNTMSHEIRTPLNGIIGFSDIMIQEDDYEDFGSMAQAINRQGLQLLNIVDSILKYTEIQTKGDLKEKTSIHGTELIYSLSEEFKKIQNKYNREYMPLQIQDNANIADIQLFTHIEAILDIVKIQFDNALKFSSKGEVTLSINKIDESGLLLIIKDEGIGIEEDKAEEIFKHFSQIESGHNRKYEGIGLGLSFAKKIVELLGGNIWYEKNEKSGSSFFTHIPECMITQKGNLK